MNTIAFHGTKRIKIFHKFSLDNVTKNPTYNGSDEGLGIFLVNKPIMAEFFAGIYKFEAEDGEYISTGNRGTVYQVEFELKKPLVISIEGNENKKYEDSVQKYFALIEKVGGAKKLRELLLSQGYDGIVCKDATTNYYIEDDTYTLYVVLDPNMVRITDYLKY